MSVVATYTGVNEILDAFETQAKKGYFSLWVNKSPALQNVDNDLDIAKIALKKKIEDFAKANFTQIFVIHLHNAAPDKKVGSYLHNDICYTMLYCQAKAATVTAVPMHDTMNANLYPIYNLIEKQNEIITALTSKVNAVEAGEETDEQIGSAEVQMLDKLGSIMNGPVGVLCTTYLPRLLDRILPETKTVSAIAGTDQTDLETTINTLFSKGVTLEHLQKLAAMPEVKIKMLITML